MQILYCGWYNIFRAIDGISNHRRKKLQKLCVLSEEPSAKRQKHSASLDRDDDESATSSQQHETLSYQKTRVSKVVILNQNASLKQGNTRKTLELEHELYNVTATLLENMNLRSDADHLRRLAEQLKLIL